MKQTNLANIAISNVKRDTNWIKVIVPHAELGRKRTCF